MQPAPHLRDTSPACRERGARVGPALAGGGSAQGGTELVVGDLVQGRDQLGVQLGDSPQFHV